MNEVIQRQVDSILERSRQVGTHPSEQLSAEQRAYLKRRAQEVGQTRTSEVESAWPQLLAEVIAEMQRATLPSDPKVKALAQRWQALVSEFTGGRSDLSRGLQASYQQHLTPEDQQVWAYIAQAIKAE